LYLVYSSVHGGAVLASGSNHSCALLEVVYSVGGPYSAREVRCWGKNDSGQIGDGTTTNRLSMTAVSGGTAVAVAVAAGASHSCLLTYTGAVSCWGLNSSGQLGDGTTTNRSSPVSVSLPLPAVGITAGDAHTCAVLSDSTVRCWGRNRWNDYSPSPARYGTVGHNDGSTDVFTSPTTVLDGVAGGHPTLTGVRMVVAGGRHTCALMAAGTVRCWGINDYGQVNGSAESSGSLDADAAVFQTGQPAITAISVTAGADFSCAVKANGQALCWGDDTP
jgi:alpha-tubulin suppressor-like RCC1 family protein